MGEKQQTNTAFGALWNWAAGQRIKFILSIILAIIGVACQMIPYFFAIRIILKILSASTDLNGYIIDLSMILAGFLGKILFSNISTLISHNAAYNTLEHLRKNIIKKLARVPMGAIMESPSGYYKNILVDRIEAMEVPFAHMFPEMTSNLLVPLFIIIYIFIIDIRMGFLSIGTLILSLIIMSVGMMGYAEASEEVLKVNRRMTNAVIEYIGGIEVVKAFSRSAQSYEKYTGAVNENANFFIKWMKKSTGTMAAYNSLLPAVFLFVLPGGLALWISGSLDTASFISCIIFSMGIVSPLMEVFTFSSSLILLGGNAAEIEKLLNASELDRGKENVILDQGGIEFRNVSFAYDNENTVLKNVDLSFKPGTLNSIVGPSGSGKSTIAKLIAGHWDVTDGELLIGNHSASEIPLPQLMEHIVYVSQDNYLFNRSVRDNIRIGNPAASDEEVENAAKKSGCDTFIKGLDHGYDTIVGSSGSHLSGGERQRIAIARAMLKDAPVIILDEATAFLDPENEAEVQRAISELTKGKTLIVIAHRLSTIVNSDQIMVVNNGSVEASGTHEKLLDSCSLYRNMWNAHISAKDGLVG